MFSFVASMHREKLLKVYLSGIQKNAHWRVLAVMCFCSLSADQWGEEGEESPWLYLRNFPGLNTLDPCLHVVAVLKHRVLWNFLDQIPYCVCIWFSAVLPLANGAFEVCVASVCKPGQLRVPGPVCTHWLWDLHLSELSGTHTRDTQLLLCATFATAAAPAGHADDSSQQPVWELCCCSCSSSHLHKAELRSWAEPIPRTRSNSRTILMQSAWSDYSLRGVSKLEQKLSVSFTQC